MDSVDVLVYGHTAPDVEFWDLAGWTWHTEPIETEVAPLVKFLNVNGVRTLASCCGHGREKGYVCIAEWSVPKARSLGFEVRQAPDGWPWAVCGEED